ncbi:hypothetical protein FRC09_004847, partial [Ceratobasidium sp. 395]
MSGYQLSDIRSRITQNHTAPLPTTLHTLLDRLPEPTTTASGTVPGKALFDKPSSVPAEPKPASQGRYPQHVRIATAAIAQHNEEIAQEKARRKSRKPYKPHKKRSSNSLASESEYSTSQYASDAAPTSPRDDLHVGSGAGALLVQPTGPRGPVADTLRQARHPHRVLSNLSERGVPQVPGDMQQDQAVVDNGAESEAGSAEEGSADRDREIEEWDFSVDVLALANELARLTGSNPTNFSDYLPCNLQALIESCYRDQTPQSHVQSPKQRKAEAKPAAKQALQLLGGGHHLDQHAPNWSGSSSHNPITQKTIFAEDYNTDTEPETKDQSFVPTTAAYDQPNNPPHRPSNSPSPLPRGFSNSLSPLPSSLPLLELPIHHARKNLGETRDLTQPKPTSRTRSTTTLPPLTRQTTSATDVAEQTASRPGSQESHRRTSSSISLGQPARPPTPSPHVASSQRSNVSARASTKRTARHTSTHTSTAGPSSRPSQAADQDRLPLGIISKNNSYLQLSTLDAQARARGSGAVLREQRASRAPTEPAPAPTLRFPPGPATDQAWNTARSRFCARLELERRRGEQKALAAAASTSNPTANDRASQHSRPSQAASPPDLVPDNEEELVAAAAEANGRHPRGGRKKKPAARNVHGNERYMLTAVKQALYAFAVSEGAWPTRGLLKRWIAELWMEVWEVELPGVPIEPPSLETVQVIMNGLPTFRCKAKDLTRTFTEHKQHDPVYGHYESPLLTEDIAETIFPNPTGIGNAFSKWYNPMLLTAVAFVLAN